MFLAGLKFVLGIVAGLTLLSVIATAAMMTVDLFVRWRKRHLEALWKAKERALRRGVAQQFREHAVFCLHFHTDDWLSERDKDARLPSER
jgi:hypothetical protein